MFLGFFLGSGDPKQEDLAWSGGSSGDEEMYIHRLLVQHTAQSLWFLPHRPGLRPSKQVRIVIHHHTQDTSCDLNICVLS